MGGRKTNEGSVEGEREWLTEKLVVKKPLKEIFKRSQLHHITLGASMSKII